MKMNIEISETITEMMNAYNTALDVINNTELTLERIAEYDELWNSHIGAGI